MLVKEHPDSDPFSPRVSRDELQRLIVENTGRIVDNHRGRAFVYREWPEEVEGGTVPSVRVVGEVRNEDNRRIHPMEFNVCRFCAGDLKPIGEIDPGDPELVCLDCKSFHTIP